MPVDSAPGLKDAFEGRKTKQTQTGELPGRIKKHASAPELRPGGSWKQRAQAVDQAVREKHEAQKAKQECAARIKAERKQGMGMSFRRSAGP